ncbi:MAG: SMI1/KNR4 family protein [Candidatus Methylumidiphilus sp.]
MIIKIYEVQDCLTEEKIASIEKKLGIDFPIEYRVFILQNNGGWPEPDGFDISWREDQECGKHWRTSSVSRFLSIDASQNADFLKYNLTTFKGRVPKDTIAIAHDPCGNLILLGVAGEYVGNILFWVKDYECEEGEVPSYDNVGLLADSLVEFINKKLR